MIRVRCSIDLTLLPLKPKSRLMVSMESRYQYRQMKTFCSGSGRSVRNRLSVCRSSLARTVSSAEAPPGRHSASSSRASAISPPPRFCRPRSRAFVREISRVILQTGWPVGRNGVPSLQPCVVHRLVRVLLVCQNVSCDASAIGAVFPCAFRNCLLRPRPVQRQNLTVLHPPTPFSSAFSHILTVFPLRLQQICRFFFFVLNLDILFKKRYGEHSWIFGRNAS